ncbi:transposase, IS4 family protein [Salinisphaera shabanensis T35B1]
MFLAQALSADGSCRWTVDQAATFRVLAQLPCCSTATGGYCRARARLPLALIQQLTRKTARQCEAQPPAHWHSTGRPVRVVDGTTLSLPDTPANQARYPQPRSQRTGLGFPICRVVAAFNLADGALMDAAIGGYRGKGAHEQALLRELLEGFAPDDILLGDALFSTYFLLAELAERGMDGVFEQHGARRRSTDFRRGQTLGSRDHRITLTKPRKKPDWMSAQAYAAAPDHLTVRELAVGGKVLVTTLIDAQQWPKRALQQLYQQRWDIEINLRHIKTTLGMATLRCRTPDMAEKEVWVHLLAYNLIRILMADSARYADVLPRQLSFKHTLQLWESWRCQARWITSDTPVDALLELIAQHRVANRPGRIEPRAVKRRPKPFPLLCVPRPDARAFIRQHSHPRRKSGESFRPKTKAAVAREA